MRADHVIIGSAVAMHEEVEWGGGDYEALQMIWTCTMDE
jgi:hypothetical protein